MAYADPADEDEGEETKEEQIEEAEAAISAKPAGSTSELQDELDFRGVQMQIPLVYRMLGRLELAKYVRGRYRQHQTPEGRTIRERHYRVTETGLAEWQQTVAFYAAMLPPPDHFEAVPNDEY